MNGLRYESRRIEVEGEDSAVSNFREYLRYKTMEPNPEYDECIAFLSRLADEIGLPVQRVEVSPGYTIVIVTWAGTKPELKSIVLNSHMDVVPVSQDQWICDAFEAKKMENGDIVARGTQDTKCVGIQYLEAIRRLKSGGIELLRTIHVTFCPYEEMGGMKGMKLFVKTPEFRNLNMGFGLDEGLANPTEKFIVYNAERATWWVDIVCKGNQGHALMFIEDTAPQKALFVANELYKYRAQEKKRMEDEGILLGDVQTVNLTKLSGGVANNVIPREVILRFDLRLSPLTTPEFLENKLKEITTAAGDNVTYEFIRKGLCYTSELEGTAWWKAFYGACKKEKVELQIENYPGATDSCYLRALGFPVLGFSPINHTEILLHNHNEYLNERVFLRGIEVYEAILPAIANVTDEEAGI